MAGVVFIGYMFANKAWGLASINGAPGIVYNKLRVWRRAYAPACACHSPARHMQVYGELGRNDEAVASAERALSIIKVLSQYASFCMAGPFTSHIGVVCRCHQGCSGNVLQAAHRHVAMLWNAATHHMTLTVAWFGLSMGATCTNQSVPTGPRSSRLYDEVQRWRDPQGLSGVLSYEHMLPFYKRAAAARDQAGDRDGAHELRKKMLRHKQRR